MCRLGLSQLIDMPNVEIPGAEARSIKKRRHLAATGGLDSSEEADPTISSGGDVTKGEGIEEPSQPGVIDPQPYIPRAHWPNMGCSSGGPSVFTRVAR